MLVVEGFLSQLFMEHASSVSSLEGRDGLDLVVKGVVDYISEFNSWLILGVVKVGESVLHPRVVETLGEVVSGVGTTRLLSVLGGIHCHLSLDHEVIEFHSLNKISVPDVSPIADTKISNAL